MADPTVTAAEVLPGTVSVFDIVTWGATVTAGQPVYKDATDSDRHKPTDGDLSPAAAKCEGVAMTGGAAGQPGILARPGSIIDPGFNVGVGERYYASGAAGGLSPSADVASDDYPSLILLGITAESAKVVCENSTVAIP